MHVNVATMQAQPEPESAVTVRPGGGSSVTVTVPLDGEVPMFVTLSVNVMGCPGMTTPPVCVFAIVRSLPDTGEVTLVGSVAVLLPPFGSPPPDTTAVFVTVPGATLAPTFVVTVMSG
jgi:hypothetical protein